MAATPYQPYTSELVAPVNPQQYSGIANINAYQPAFQTGLGMAYQAAQPITPGQISQYESPYTQQVINATQAQFNNQNAQQQQQVLGSAASQGALGGNRVGIAQAELANQQQLAQAPVIANLQNQGYLTGLNTALTEQQALSQGAYGVANLAQAGLTGANTQIGAGGLEQQTQQAYDTAQYQQYLNALGYPFQTTQWLAGVGTGVGSQLGGTTTGTGTTTGPAPNSTAQWLGLGAAGLGAFGSYAGSAAGSAALAALPFIARGGRVDGYADGGGVAGPSASTIPESPHTLRAQQRQLVAGDRHVQMFPHDTPELPVPHGMKRVESHSGVFHYNPKHVKESDIHKYSRGGHEHVLLGLGPYSKHEILHRLARGEHPVAVVERNEHGHEVRAALGTHATAAVQHHHMSRGKSKNHTVHIEHPHKVLSERMQHIARRQSGGGVSNYPVFGGGFGQPTMPYSGGSSYIPGIGIVHGAGAPPPLQMSGSSGQQQQPQTPPDYKGITKNLGSFFSGLQNQDQGSPSGVGNVSSEDEAGFENVDWGEARGGAVGVANYDSGGNVEPLPMSPDQMADSLDRLKRAGILNPSAARDYASARLKRLGFNPKTYTGQDAPYAGGGVAGYDSGGSPDDDTPYQVASLEPGDIGPTGVSGGVPMITGAQHSDLPQPVIEPAASEGTSAEGVAPNVPLPTPRPTVASSQSIPGEPGVGVEGRLTPSGVDVGNQQYGAVDNSILDRAAAATKHQESGGDYNNVTTTHNSRGQPQSALGAYGIMDFNLPQWSKQALGREVTRDEFLANPSIQDQIYRYKMGQYINRFGVEGAGRAWLGGEGSLNAPLAKDAFGTTVGGYGQKFAQMVGDGGPTQTDQSALPATAVPTQATGVAPPEQKPNFFAEHKDLWPALMAAGFGMLASRSPFLGVAVGEGAQQGLGYYTQQKNLATQVGMNQQRIDLEAKGLQQRADQFQQNYELSQKKLAQQERYQQEQIIQKGMEPKPFYNPNTGQMDYVVRTPEGDVVSVGTGQILAGPHKGQTAPGPTTPAPNQPAPNTSSTPGQPNQPGFQQAVFHPDKDGIYRVNNQMVANAQPYNYANTQDLPPVDKGMQLPEPQPINGHSGDSIKLEAQRYFETGKLPTVPRGNSPVAIGEQNYQHAVQNYAAAQARSLGLTEQQMIDFWRKAPLAAKYATSQDGRMVVSMGVAIDHLDTLKQYYDLMGKQGALAPGEIQTLNAIKAKISREFGGDAVVGLNTAAQIVGPEIAKSIVPGGGGVTERTELEKTWSGVNSPEQFNTAYQATQRLLAGQLGGRERQASVLGVRPEEFKGLIGDHAYDVLDQVRKEHTGGTSTTSGTQQTQPPARPAWVPEDAKLSKGTWYTRGPNGESIPVVPPSQ